MLEQSDIPTDHWNFAFEAFGYDRIQPGDVPATFADITRSRAELGFEPKTRIEEGLPRFVAWYHDYHKI